MENRLVLLIVINTLLLAQTAAKQEDFHKKCLASSGANADVIAKVRNGKFSNDPQTQKYFGCMLLSVGIVNQSGQLQVDVLRKKVPKDMKKDEAIKIYMSCKDKKGANNDETAYLLYKCFWEATPRHLRIDGQ
ncbi:uncharacterized protein LOC123011962 [Tribolium madens]|uniref:uncharacterized protein LOC123011962 n=1 Tax=Tribolium madens TaxID=41895 RepID=UPI001CF737FD|nr:uncharacterized protein LOC123011962 [Tribolium madens]